MTMIDVRAFGASGDGKSDDHAAVTAAIIAADQAGGGTVFVPAGVYGLSAPLGRDSPAVSRVCLLGDGDRASRLLAIGDFPVISGAWFMSRIENLFLDAGGHGSPAMVVDLDKSYVRHCWLDGWSGYGMSLNPDREGLLNWVDDNFVEQREGTGIHTTYRFFDSWIVNNNIGSTGPNMSVESGPVRILANHLNGTPRYNIELRGNKSLTIIGNICEGSRQEAIRYTMPQFLDRDRAQVQIVANNITNGGKQQPGRYPAIGIYSRDADHRTGGFSVTGNYFACEDTDAGWSYAVDAEYVDVLSITGNQWDNNGYTTAPVRSAGAGVSIAGNTSGNDGPRVLTLSAPTVLPAAAREHGQFLYFLADGAAVTLPAAADDAARYTFKNVASGDVQISVETGERIDGKAGVTVRAGAAVDVVSDGAVWWTL
jgi:Pectate lyase superfamily protein